MVGQEDDRVTVGRHLHGPGDHALGVERSPAVVRATPTAPRLGPQADPDPVATPAVPRTPCRPSRVERIGAELLGMRPGDDAQRHRLAVPSSSVAAPATRWSPSGGAHAPACSTCSRCERAGAEAGQLVGGRAAEPRRVRGSRPPPPGSVRQPPRRRPTSSTWPAAERQQLAVRVPASRRRGPRVPPRRRRHGTRPRQRSRVPPPVSSSVPAAAALPTSRLASIERDRVGRTGAGDTRRRPRPDGHRPGGRRAAPAPRPRTRPGRRRAADHDGGRTGSPARRARPAPATVNWTRSPGASTAYGGRAGTEQREPGAPDQVPASRRRGRVDGGVAVGERHRPGGHRRARPGAPGHPRRSGLGRPSR